MLVNLLAYLYYVVYKLTSKAGVDQCQYNTTMCEMW